MSLKSPGSNGGTTSKLAVKESGLPSSTTTSFTSGVSTGSTPRAESTESMVRGIRSWATSWRICARKRWRTTEVGTLPGRKPGSRADFVYSRVTRSMADSTSVVGISTVRCLRVSLTSTSSVFI